MIQKAVHVHNDPFTLFRPHEERVSTPITEWSRVEKRCADPNVLPDQMLRFPLGDSYPECLAWAE